MNTRPGYREVVLNLAVILIFPRWHYLNWVARRRGLAYSRLKIFKLLRPSKGLGLIGKKALKLRIRHAPKAGVARIGIGLHGPQKSRGVVLPITLRVVGVADFRKCLAKVVARRAFKVGSIQGRC